MYELEDRMLFDAALAVDAAAVAAADNHSDSAAPAADTGDGHESGEPSSQADGSATADSGAADHSADASSDSHQGGDAPATGGDAPENTASDHAADGGDGSDSDTGQAALDAGDQSGVSALLAQMDGSAPSDSDGHRVEIMVIDSSVPDPDAIVAATRPDVEVHVLNPGEGLEAVSSILNAHGKDGVDALYVVAHGNSGELVLGSDLLNPDTIANHGDVLASWDHALSDGADVELFACDVAAGAEGMEFLSEFADATGADIAASVDGMGNDDGWTMDRSVGAVESASPFLKDPDYHDSLGTYRVYNTRDSGWGSLRDAITNANRFSNADVITFSTTGTITLASDLPRVTNPLSIVGPGADSLIIDGNHSVGNVLYFRGRDTNVNFQMSGVTLTNGRTGLLSWGHTVLSDMTITNCHGTNRGGGVTLGSGTLELNSGTSINHCSSTNGAGIFSMNRGTLLVVNDGVEITDNTATGYGGGILNSSGVVQIKGGKISGNTADYGGGLYNYTSSSVHTYMTGGEITGNTALHDGGGVYNNWDFSMHGGKISGNTAVRGGGVCNPYHDFSMDGGVISGNTASDQGGGVYGMMVMNNGEISGNTAAYGGGWGISRGGSMNNGEISGNTATNDGGGVYMDYSRGYFRMHDGLISGNTAAVNGGGVANNNGTFYLYGGEISNNSADYGGGVWDNHDFRMYSNAEISNNTATYGGGVALPNSRNARAYSDGEIKDNTAVNGGGVWADRYFGISTGCSISDNTATGDGGGVWGGTSSYLRTQNGGRIEGNTAVNGGGISSQHTVLLESGAVITGNTASGLGGGVHLSGGGASVEAQTGASIDHNTAVNGGGIGAENGATVTIRGGGVSSNTATNDGGGIWSDSMVSSSDGGTVSGNHAGGDGGGIYANMLQLSGYNNTLNIANNTADGDGGGLWTHTVKVYRYATPRVNVTGNHAGGDGGGIWYDNRFFCDYRANPRFNISNNTADGNGGGIWAGGNLNSMYYSSLVVDSNTAGGNGGGVWNHAGFDPWDARTSITNNTADGDGGGMWNDGHVSLLRQGAMVDGNTATGDGGGIYNSGTLNTSNGSFANNSARDGGAIYNTGSAHVETDVDSNTATGDGGGVWNGASGTLTIYKTISHNTAGGNGGGIYNAGTADVRAGVSSNSATNGGGIHNAAGDLTLRGSVTGNAASESGGGIWTSGDTTLTGATVSGNVATNGSGGGVYFNASNKTLNVNSCAIDSNTANSGKGGGVSIGPPSCEDPAPVFTFNSDSTTYNGNSADDGGAIFENLYNRASTENLTNATFTNNTAARYGGAMAVHTDGTRGYEKSATSAFAGNVAGVDGDDVYVCKPSPASSASGTESFWFNGVHDATGVPSALVGSSSSESGSLDFLTGRPGKDELSGMPDGEREVSDELFSGYRYGRHILPADDAFPIPIPDDLDGILNNISGGHVAEASAMDIHPAMAGEIDVLLATAEA